MFFSTLEPVGPKETETLRVEKKPQVRIEEKKFASNEILHYYAFKL